MKPSEIKWEDYLPIPWGRTKRFLLITSGLLMYLLLTLLGSVASRLNPSGDLASILVLAVIPALLFHGIVVGGICGEYGGLKVWWNEMYRARNIIGYDTVYRLKEGALDCNVVGRYGTFWPDDWTVRIPFNKRRSGRISGWVTAVTPECWQVTLTAQTLDQPPDFSNPESLWVRLSDGTDAGLEMKLPHTMEIIKKHILGRDIRSVRDLLDSLLCDLASFKWREEIFRKENEAKTYQLQEAHSTMTQSMLALAHSTRLNSPAAQRIRMGLAMTLAKQADQGQQREFYERYTNSRRPPRVRTT